ncbi:recombinase family protein [Asticcacaulis sp. AND118]|uniref:recombinase family protein n=1 Tax=Asticcacaulis sp. AND118 TaxID=2840468 RepID=UPI001CFFB0B2|nr:recombinase family protein [Asticcacaulis sp. AND118]
MRTNEQRIAFIYARVSSKKQEKLGHGLDSQTATGREFAEHRNHQVVKVFREAISGARHGRPAMKEMLIALRQYKARGIRVVVIIDHIDRLARDYEVHRDLRRKIRNAGGDLECPSMEFRDDIDSEYVEGIQALNSEYQRKKNGEQVIKRMRGRLLDGFYVYNAPVGYDYIDTERGKILVPQEPVAGVIREALEGFASGRFATQAEVRRFLNSRAEFPKDSTGRVHHARVPELLKRVVYSGYVEAPDWNVSLRKGHHEPIISYQTYQRIQQRLAVPVHAPARKDFNEDFPLRGSVCCADCNAPLRAGWTKGRVSYHAYYCCHTKACASYGKSIRREKIEGEFEAVLDTIRPAPALFDAMRVLVKVWWEKVEDDLRKSAVTLKDDLIKLEKKAETLIDLVIDATSLETRTMYEKRLRDIEKEKVAIREKIDRKREKTPSFDGAYRTAMLFLSNPSILWKSPVLENKKAVLKLAFAAPLIYSRFDGYRTAETTLPFKVLAQFSDGELGMVDATGIEPVTLRV